MEQRDFPPISDNTGTKLASAVGAPLHMLGMTMAWGKGKVHPTETNPKHVEVEESPIAFERDFNLYQNEFRVM